MRDKICKGLLAFWSDIDEDYILEFQRWHNCEHMTERVSIPGFHVGRRYRGIESAPMFFMCYETADSAVLKGEAYMRAINNPSPWTREALNHFNNNIRNIYRLVAADGRPAPTEAPYIYVLRFNLEHGAEKEWLEWYPMEYLAQICAIPGVYRGRIYEIDEEVSNIMTAERSIYGGGPGQQKYLAIYEIASLDLPTGPRWQEVGQTDKRNQEMLKEAQDVYEELSWLEFVMYAPEKPLSRRALE